MNNFQDAIGKTITKIEHIGLSGYDDEPYLRFTFSDGDTLVLEGGYGDFTGKSEDEYVMLIGLLHKCHTDNFDKNPVLEVWE